MWEKLENRALMMRSTLQRPARWPDFDASYENRTLMGLRGYVTDAAASPRILERS